jgi:hypothetical protein
MKGLNIAFESMKINFNLACLHKFTPNGPEWGVGGGEGGYVIYAEGFQ